MIIIAQAASQVSNDAATYSLYSVSAILATTWLVVGYIKYLFDVSGKETLVWALAVAMTLTAIAYFWTGTLTGDPLAIVLSLLGSIAGAAGIDSSKNTLTDPNNRKELFK